MKRTNKIKDYLMYLFDNIFNFLYIIEGLACLGMFIDYFLRGDNSLLSRLSVPVSQSPLGIAELQGLIPWMVAMLIIMVIFLLNLLISSCFSKSDKSKTSDNQDSIKLNQPNK